MGSEAYRHFESLIGYADLVKVRCPLSQCVCMCVCMCVYVCVCVCVCV